MNNIGAYKRRSLAGEWRFALDEERVGVQEKWYAGELPDQIQLPGTTAEQKKGRYNDTIHIAHLSEEYPYAGVAWYQRTIDIPAEWKGMRIRLFLERSRLSQLWLNDSSCGMQASLSTPHVYELGYLEPGSYRLTILVQNTDMPIAGGHMTSPDTQSNWNGIVGRLELQAVAPLRLENIQLFPEPARQSLRLQAELVNEYPELAIAHVSLSVSGNDPEEGLPDSIIHTVNAAVGRSSIELECTWASGTQLWDEWSPHLYTLTAAVSEGDSSSSSTHSDQHEIVFGMRSFQMEGSQFVCNDRKVFLRGKHDGLAFPITGYASMDEEEWVRVLTIAKSYGINHYRYHTCCPPEAGFAAADRVGVYFEPELPYWGAFHAPGEEGYKPELAAYLREEAIRILQTYGNHPSFVLFTLGNEWGGSRQAMTELLEELRREDGGRRLMAEGANNFFWNPTLSEASDFWVTMRTSKGGGAVRGSYSHADLPLGHVQSQTPSTQQDFGEAIAGIPVPVIGHETGQYQSYPDYREMERYTGVLKPRNLDTFRQRLEQKGMLDQAEAFTSASGQLAVLCYREDIEAALRTRGFGGFQLLDLQDFPGQGTALVGVLNALMESKGFIEPEQWREFCSDRVLLARFPSYIYENHETFEAELEYANYGNGDEEGAADWALWHGELCIASGTTQQQVAAQGTVTGLGSISASLTGVEQAAKLRLSIHWQAGGPVQTSYPIWVYPSRLQTLAPNHVHVASELDNEAEEILRQGGRVVFMPTFEGNEAGLPGYFASDFWSYPMFRAICESAGKTPAPGTLGLLCDDKHGALKSFPTEYHSNWQWWSIVMRSRALILDHLPTELRPIVQVIDNFERNHKLALLFEAKVGEGRLIVCSSDLRSLEDRPEARQLWNSIMAYAASEDFKPSTRVELAHLREALQSGREKGERFDAVENTSYL
ncbi:sugar-binding domain-containing protein [Paenibacillus daejeonensis]|uniref:sugar-binding domain-containing protein n=1 Tax=Paenibacillus daejeonensis TaxID=135193 RepID=UPI00037F5ED9|nr:sugar-binding domain-containing protein [Paenibacillus daejeonensis]